MVLFINQSPVSWIPKRDRRVPQTYRVTRIVRLHPSCEVLDSSIQSLIWVIVIERLWSLCFIALQRMDQNFLPLWNDPRVNRPHHPLPSFLILVIPVQSISVFGVVDSVLWWWFHGGLLLILEKILLRLEFVDVSHHLMVLKLKILVVLFPSRLQRYLRFVLHAGSAVGFCRCHPRNWSWVLTIQLLPVSVVSCGGICGHFLLYLLIKRSLPELKRASNDVPI